MTPRTTRDHLGAAGGGIFDFDDGTHRVELGQAFADLAGSEGLGGGPVGGISRLATDFAQHGDGDAGFFFNDPCGVTGLDAFVLRGVADEHESRMMFFGQIDHRLELTERQQPIFVDDDGFVGDGCLQNRIDQQPLDGRGLLQGGAGGRASGSRLLFAVAPEDFNGLGAGGETGDLAFYEGHALDGTGQRVGLAGAGPAAQHGRTVTGLEVRINGGALFCGQYFPCRAGQVSQFRQGAGGDIEPGDQRTLKVERGPGRDLTVRVKEGMVATIDGFFDEVERVLAIGLPADFGGEFVNRPDRFSLKHVLDGPLDGDGEGGNMGQAD